MYNGELERSTGPFRRIGVIHRTSWPVNRLKVWEIPRLSACGLVMEPNRWFSCPVVVAEGFGGSREALRQELSHNFLSRPRSPPTIARIPCADDHPETCSHL